jgi:hypothetical protein
LIDGARAAVTTQRTEALVLPGLVPGSCFYFLARLGGANPAFALAQRAGLWRHRLGHAHRRIISGGDSATDGWNGAAKHSDVYHPWADFDGGYPGPVVPGQAEVAGKRTECRLWYCIDHPFQDKEFQEPSEGQRAKKLPGWAFISGEVEDFCYRFQVLFIILGVTHLNTIYRAENHGVPVQNYPQLRKSYIYNL